MSEALVKELLRLFAAVAPDVDLVSLAAEVIGKGFEPPAVCEICKATIPGAADLPWTLCQSCALVIGWDGCTPTVTRTFTVARRLR